MPNIEDLARQAKEVFDRMTPDQQRAMQREQRISFAWGNVNLHNPSITREMVEAEDDKLFPS